MKYIVAESASPLEGLEMGKMSLTIKDDGGENIWIKRDGDKAYLQNHSIHFWPFPTWGMQVPNQSSFDVTEMRGENPDETVLTLHPVAYNSLKEKAWIDDEGVLLDKYFEDQIRSSQGTEEAIEEK